MLTRAIFSSTHIKTSQVGGEKRSGSNPGHRQSDVRVPQRQPGLDAPRGVGIDRLAQSSPSITDQRPRPGSASPVPAESRGGSCLRPSPLPSVLRRPRATVPPFPARPPRPRPPPALPAGAPERPPARSLTGPRSSRAPNSCRRSGRPPRRSAAGPGGSSGRWS